MTEFPGAAHENAAGLKRALQTLAFFAAILGLYILFSHRYYLDPVLFGKDCAQTFQYFYGGDRPITSIYLKLQGYFSFVMYLFPWLFAKFPTPWQPGLYTLSAAAFAALPAVFIFWSTLFRTWPARCTFAALAGFWHYWAGSVESVGSIYIAAHMSFWPVCLLYYLIVLQLLADRQQSRSACLLTAAALPALLSHPYTVAALPALLFIAFSRVPRATRACALLLISVSVLYATTHDQSKANYWALLQPQTMLAYTHYLVNSIVLLDFVALPRAAAVAVAVVAVAVLLPWFFYRRQDFRTFCLRDGFILLFIAGLSAIYFASYRVERYGDIVPTRYGFVQQILWLVFLARRLEQIPFAARPLPVRAGLWLLVACGLLAARGAGGASSFMHLHTHEAAARQELFSAMGRLEKIAARHPEVAFLVLAPNHNWPTRSFLVGKKGAAELVDFEHSSREELLGKLRGLGADEDTIAVVRRAHEIYGFEKNLVKNGNFADWQGNLPRPWVVEGSGKTSYRADKTGDPVRPLLTLQCEGPGSSVSVSQVVDIGPHRPGAILRFKVHSRQSDGGALKVTFASEGESGWMPFEERSGTRYPNWLRQTFDVKLPETIEHNLVRITMTVAPVKDAVSASLTHTLVAVRDPKPAS